ncbi:PAS domain S-box protein [Pseudanabaena sp. BC1403]|uniref:PAS domain S-box protein n=1 Tax=Pseudanabaena sp. BC1403 TaxID=2043171 RepID=UPI000CD991D7|nr:PAS domain S-box protein [Pseudanabaena sp. BC1403]
MKKPETPENESDRLAALNRYKILDTLPEQVYDNLVQLASHICGTPIALISLVDRDRQWFKSRVGIDATETSREISFCGHAVAEKAILHIPDTKEDARFSDNPLVVGEPKIRFYLGVPLITPDNYALGTLCVIAPHPKQLTPQQIKQLEMLSHLVVSQLELRLAEETSRLLVSVVESSNDAIVTNTFDGIITSWNPAAERLFGYSVDEVLGKSIFMMIPSDRVQEEMIFIEHLKRGERMENFESIRLHKDGSPRDVSFSISPLIDAIGTVVGASKIARDITAIKQSQSQLRDITNALNNTALVAITDVNGTITFANDKFCEISKYSREELIGQNHRILNSGHHPHNFFANMWKEIASGKIWQGEIKNRTKDGCFYWVDTTIIPFINDQGNPYQYLAVRQDITNLKRNESKLMQAIRLKDEFLANMSHELRTPLNAILGMSESLQEQILGPINTRQSDAISMIEKSGEHLLSLINDILELSKIESGKLELDIEKVAIEQLCKSSLSFVKQQAFKKQIQINVKLSQDLGEMILDQRRMRQVLINLLTNAVKFTATGGKVTLEVYYEPLEITFVEHKSLKAILQPNSPDWKYEDCDLKDSRYLCFSVTDTGIGISPADQEKLFQPFVQIDSKLNRQYEGTGLGLALVKRIVELHGGNVRLRSKLNEGSCFTVRLPYICQAPNIEGISPTHSSIAPKTNTKGISQSDNKSDIASEKFDDRKVVNPPLIMLAEDNEANVMTVSSYLKAKEYRVIIAQNGVEAIAIAKEKRPDLILMDIQMPVMDGLTAIAQIRLDPSLIDIPIIALTALAMEDDRDRCLAVGANEYMSKPIKLKQLDLLMQKLL